MTRRLALPCMAALFGLTGAALLPARSFTKGKCCYGKAPCSGPPARCDDPKAKPFCAESQVNCETHCNGHWCGGPAPPPAPPTPPLPPPGPPPPPGAAPLPAELIKRIQVGINMGNTMEAPHEGDFQAPATEALFDTYAKAGFKGVRIPVRWDMHTAKIAPYAVDEAWLARVEQVVGWSTKRGLITIVNTHHEVWLDSAGKNFGALLPRLEAIWTQASARLAPVNDSLLIFEVFNEPKDMSADDLNAMNAAVLPIIRKTNPTRTVLFGGLKFMNPSWLLANPDALKFPSRTADPYVAVEIHNYDPYKYAGPNPSQHSWGSAHDKALMDIWIDETKAWAATRGLAVVYGEFGVTHAQTAATGRIAWYNYTRTRTLAAGFGIFAWDDGGKFAMLNRTSMQWDAPVVRALGRRP